MSTISSATSSSLNAYTAATTSAAGSTVAKTADAELAQTAVSLSAEASVVATLGGGLSSAVTYDAAGLLNTFTQAGSAPSATQTADNSANPQAAAQNSTDQGIVSTLPSDPATSGIYSSSGSLNDLPSNVSSNWASILKTNPSLASSVISDSFNQGIIGTLSTTA
jgi:hypothetical protein